MNIPKKGKLISAILSLLGLSLGTSMAADPAGVPGAVLWLDAAQLAGLTDGQTVSTWTDMSGNGNNATLSKGAPKYQINVLNGQPVMRFTAADMFATANLSAQFPSAATLFIVATINSASYDFLYTGSAWSEWWRYGGNGNSYPAVFRSRINEYCTMPSTGTRLFTVSSSASAWRMSIDGVSKGVVSGSYSAGGVQNIPGNANEASPCACDIAEVIEFNRVLTSAEESAVNIYLADKYGLAIAIDAQHAPGDMYWDNNGSIAGFGPAAGTWAAPTTGNSSQGWSGDPTGSTLPIDFTTAVTNTLRFGSAEAGLAAGTVTVSGDVTASNLTFAGGSGAITLTGGTITLADTSSITVNNNATISSVLAGAANSLTKQGPGYLTLSGGNTMTGDVTVRQGALAIASGVLGTAVSVIVEDGAKLEMGAWANAIANPIRLSGHGPGGAGALIGWAMGSCTGPITLLTDSTIQKSWHAFFLNNTISGTDKNLILLTTDGTAGMYVNGAISLGSGALSISGIAWTDLNASNSFSGGTTVGTSSGGLKIGHVNALGSGGLTVNSGSVDLNTLSISIPSLSGTGGVITDYGAAGTTTLSVTQSVNTTYSGVISDGASRVVTLTKTGAGTLTLAGKNTYTGATLVNTGKLLGGTGGNCSKSSVVVATGATNGVKAMVYGAEGSFVCSNLTYMGDSGLDFDMTTLPVNAGVVPLIINGDLTVTGVVQISVSNGYWPATGTYPLVRYSGNLNGPGSFNLASLPAGVSATLVNNTGAKRLELNVTAIPAVSFPLSVWTNNGGGTWGTAANWNGGTIADGTDVIADFSTLDLTANASVNNDAPHTVGQLRFGDTSPSHNWELLNSTLTLATSLGLPTIHVSNGSVNIETALQGTQGLFKTGAGELNLRQRVPEGGMGSNTYSGGTYILEGTLIFGGNNWVRGMIGPGTVYLGDSSGSANAVLQPEYSHQNLDNNIIVQSGNTGIMQINNNCGSLNLLGTITLGSSGGNGKSLTLGTVIQNRWLSLYVTGTIQDPINMTPGTAGTVTINHPNGVRFRAANTYSGPTVILSGWLMQEIANAVPAASAVTVNSGCTFDLAGFNGSIGSLAGSGTVNLNVNTLTVGNDNTSTTFSGIIANAGSLTKTGSGTLTLAGTSTYSGATAISNGTLAVNGALSSSGVTVCTGAAFAAGSTGVVGSAELAGTLTFQNSSALLVDVAAVADAVVAAGNVVIGTGVEIRLSGSQEKSGSWEIIKTTGGTVQGSDPVLINGLNGAKLSRTATAIVLTIPPKGTLIRIL